MQQLPTKGKPEFKSEDELETLTQTFRLPLPKLYRGEHLPRFAAQIEFDAFWFRNEATHLKCKT